VSIAMQIPNKAVVVKGASCDHGLEWMKSVKTKTEIYR